MYIILCTYIIIHMQANRQIQNYQAFVLFKKRKTARASGLIRRTPAFFSAIFLVRLLHAPISRAVRRKTAAAAEIVRPSGDKVHRPPRARVKVRVERFALRVHGHQHALALRRALEDVLPVRQQHRAVGAMAQCPAAPARRRQPGNILRQPVFSAACPPRGAAPRRRPLCRPPCPTRCRNKRRARRAYRTIPRTTATDALCSLKSWPRALHHGYPQRTAEAGPYTASTPRGRTAAPGCGRSQTGSWN